MCAYRRFGVIAAGIVLVVWATSARALTEDFEDGVADGWEAVSGEWVVEDGAYVQKQGQPGMDNARNRASGLEIGNKDWVDYTFTVKAKPLTASGYVGVMFRVARLGAGKDGNTFGGGSEYYYWLIGIGGTYSRIWQAPAGKLLEQSPGATVTLDQWSELRIEMKGQTVQLYLDGDLQKDFDFPADVQIESGGVALATYNAQAAFDDVEIEGDGIPRAVEPRGKLATTWAALKAPR